MPPLTVVVASPTPGIRRACARLLEAEGDARVLGEVRSGPELVTSVDPAPRVLILDGDLYLRYGVTLLRILHRKRPRTRVILLLSRAEIDPLDALANGAHGYLTRRKMRRFLAKAVRAVHLGEAWVPRRMVGQILERLARLTRMQERR